MAVVENKVTGSTAGAGAGTVIANFVLWAVAHYGHVTVDPQLVYYVNVAAAAVAAFVGGFLARHTFREDLSEAIHAAENVAMGGQQTEVIPEEPEGEGAVVVNPAEAAVTQTEVPQAQGAAGLTPPLSQPLTLGQDNPEKL